MCEFLERIRENEFKNYLQTLSIKELLEIHNKQTNIFRIRELIMDDINKKENKEK